jgi:hypothetical protein
MKLNALGMPKYRNKAHPTERYVAVRPDGRRSRVSFRSPLRAAEHAMNAFGIDNWRNLCSIGWTVQPISHFRKLTSEPARCSCVVRGLPGTHAIST